MEIVVIKFGLNDVWGLSESFLCFHWNEYFLEYSGCSKVEGRESAEDCEEEEDPSAVSIRGGNERGMPGSLGIDVRGNTDGVNGYPGRWGGI